MSRRIVVAGCSYSCAFGVNNCYAAIVAEILNLDLVHLARIATSNSRTWRVVYDELSNLDTKDTIIIQYTEPHRKEFWSPNTTQSIHQHLYEPYKSGSYFAYKYGSELSAIRRDKDLCKIMHRHINHEHVLDEFYRQHNMFAAYLKMQGFDDVWFIQDETYAPKISKLKTIDTKGILTKHHLENDPWHLNDLGHKLVARKVIKAVQAQATGSN